MPELRIPQQLDEILRQNFDLDGLVRTTASDFGTWLERNDLRFFVEYTDHSLQHVNGVLEQANDLIRPECLGLITPADVAVLVLASLLHDCAMHLTPNGFLALVQGSSRATVIPGFGDKRWDAIWEDFFAEARRFSARKLISIFGDAKPIRRPDLSALLDMSGRDLLLIGELLRRHHHRLAHEIARFGVPGPGDTRLYIRTSERTAPVADLAGLCARSHRTAIRDCLAYLDAQYNLHKTVHGAHPTFVMALLRVADALQIQPDRAPRLLDRVRDLQSPVSQLEWAAHQAIDFRAPDDKDPETLFVRATPPDARTYLRVRAQLNQIQQELDAAWAIIGEVYGFDPSFNRFGLTLRRVRSNLDDTESFARQVPYIPCHAAFDIADSDVLKLLIRPLYGHKPEFGIRELLQNAVDSVRELEEYRRLHPELHDIDLMPQKADVLIAIDQEDDGSWRVTVSDRGIGMTVDTVRNYFLKAGASFRRSELWRKTFEDADGKSRVLRSGRFGVGVLAAFLLGDEIHVTTRHVDAPEGIEFEAQLDTEALELHRIQRPVGTTVCVRISDEVSRELLERDRWGALERWERRDRWDWYCLAKPRVARALNKKTLLQQSRLPAPKSDLPPGWHRIAHPDYQDIHWTHLPAAPLTCNGILVRRDPRDFDVADALLKATTFGFLIPSLSVFDPDGNLPLNLLRTRLAVDEYPFQDELIEDTIRDFIAFCLVSVPDRPIAEPSARNQYLRLRYPGCTLLDDKGFASTSLLISPWLSTVHGVSPLLEPWPLVTLEARSLLCIHHSEFVPGSSALEPALQPHSAEVATVVTRCVRGIPRRRGQVSKAASSAELFLDGRLAHHLSRPLFHNEPLDQFLIPGRRMLLCRYAISKTVWTPDSFRANLEWENHDWALLRYGHCPKPEFDFQRYAAEHAVNRRHGWPVLLVERYLVEERPAHELSPLARTWLDLLGTPFIPFDPAERRRQFPRAFEELKPYIDGWEALGREKRP